MNYAKRPSNDGRVFPYTEERGGRRWFTAGDSDIGTSWITC
jgi:hypothetical protein